MSTTQPNWKRSAALAAGLLALGTLAYWLEYKHKPAQEANEEQGKKPFALKDAAIATIEIRDGSSRAFKFKCVDLDKNLCKASDNSKWEMETPLKLKADESNVNALLSSINNLFVTETIDLNAETSEKRAQLLKEYGLDASARDGANGRHIQLTTKDGKKIAAYLGEMHPIGDNQFVLKGTDAGVDDKKVMLAPSYFKSHLSHDLTYWRDKKLLNLAAHEVTSFTLESPRAGKIVGERKDGNWALKTTHKGKSEELPGDIENIDAFITAAGFLAAKGFDGKEVLSKTQRSLSLTLQKGGEAPITVALHTSGKPDKAGKGNDQKLYATVSGSDPVYELDLSSKDRLDKELKDLRLVKLVTSMEKFGAKRLAFAGGAFGSTPLVLKYKDSKWETEDKKSFPGELDAAKVQDLLEKVSGNRIREFIDAGAIPKGSETGVTFTFGDEKTETKRQFIFWKNMDKLYARDLLAEKNGRKEAFLIDSMTKDALPWTRDALFKAPAAAPTAAPSAAANKK